MSEDETCKPTGNPETGCFDFVEDGVPKRRLAGGTVVTFKPSDSPTTYEQLEVLMDKVNEHQNAPGAKLVPYPPSVDRAPSELKDVCKRCGAVSGCHCR